MINDNLNYDDFDKWNNIKKKINNKNPKAVKEGEVFWCFFGLNIGREQNGGKNFERIVIILKKFSRDFILVAPVTKNLHIGSWYLDIDINNKKHKVILNQIKPIDTRRLNKSICQISEKEVLNILKLYKEII